MSDPRGRASGAVTLAQVAAEAGVSPATASFVLSGRNGRSSSGSEDTKRRVRAAADRLGYIPNRYARAMRTGRSDAIVLALGTVGDPWGISLARAVRSRALPHDLATVVLTDERWYEFLSGYASDCAFVTGADLVEGGQEQVARLARSGLEIVAFGETLVPDGFDIVASSAAPAVAAAYRRLHETWGTVGYLSPTLPTSIDDSHPTSRARAFRDAARAEGDEASISQMHASGRGPGPSLEACCAWLERPDRPRAVVCSTGYVALALQAAALRMGVDVPGELEFIAIGDVPADAQLLGPISYYGVADVFDRIAGLIVDRALTPGGSGPGTKHVFEWEFFPGATTRG